MKRYKMLSICCLLTLFAIGTHAQEAQMQPLPKDPKIRYGQLENGLTYYIRHNERPKERADFYIVQKVGSMQEEDNQRGLAHFLEHMAFDGTKNFPQKTKQSIDDFTESLGMQMGSNLNAYTSFDETVYTLMDAPTTRQSAVDSMLLILHDWSSFITLADTSIEKERGVIREEWRTRSDAQSRIWEQQFPKVFPGSRYANRLPIGSIDVINNFKPDELRAYYKKWYRPDLQGIIIVGDVNVDEVEASIKRIFADIPAPVNPATREFAPVPDNKEPLVSIVKDKESTQLTLSIYYKHDRLPMELSETIAGYVQGYLRAIISSVMDERISDIVQKSDPPFIYASAGDGPYLIAKTKDAWTTAALVAPGKLDEALNALVKETNKVKKYGFTAAEYERARTNMTKMYENLYNDRDNQRNGSYTDEYTRNFTDQEPIPGIEMEYQLIQQLAPNLPVQNVNQMIAQMIGDENIVICLTGPDKDDIAYPTEEELLSKFRAAQAIPVTAKEETVSNEPLIASLPAPGKITETKEDPTFGTTIYTLSNGIKVILKETEFKKDQILMRGSSNGGNTLFGNEDAVNMKLFNAVAALGGLGNFSATDIEKMLTGKNVSCGAYLGNDFENISGNAVPADIRTLFELIYLTFTAPRQDQEAYNSFMERIKSQLENMRNNPMMAFSDTLVQAMYNGNPRIKQLEVDDLSKANYDRIMEMYRDRFSDASDFVFTFIGNINKDSMIPMMKQYLATLPTLKRTEQGDVSKIALPRKGTYSKNFHRTMETPKASILNEYFGQMDYDAQTRLTGTMLKQILDIVFTEKIREKESGSYGVSSSLDISAFPKGETTLEIYFDTDPDKKDKLNGIIHEELKNIATNGPREIDFTKTRDNLLKSHEEALQENGYWLEILDEYYYRGYDWHTDYLKTLNSITPAMIQSFAKKLLDQGNHFELIMEP